MALYDAKGNAVDDVVSKSEIAETQAQLTKATEELALHKAELDKLRSKDNSLTDFRKKTEEEKKKLLDKMSESERINFERINALEATIEAGEKEKSEMLIAQFSGGNDELGKLIQAEAAELEIARGKPATVADRRRLYSDAKAIVENRERQKINPINALNVPSNDMTDLYQSKRKKDNFADTDKGKKLAGLLGMELEEKKAS